MVSLLLRQGPMDLLGCVWTLRAGRSRACALRTVHARVDRRTSGSLKLRLLGATSRSDASQARPDRPQQGVDGPCLALAASDGRSASEMCATQGPHGRKLQRACRSPHFRLSPSPPSVAPSWCYRRPRSTRLDSVLCPLLAWQWRGAMLSRPPF